IMSHPNLVKFIDCDLNHRWPYLVQELLVGVNLRDLYRARRRLPEPAVMFITYQLTRALHQAFGFGIIHRDIKPDNCFLTSAGHIKLLDLGLAKVTGAERLTRPSDLVGTIQFMAPEQIIDASQVDCRVDAWSLGVMAYLFLTGQLPHKGKNVQEIQAAIRHNGASHASRLNPDISPLADHLVAKMTAIHPNQRHQTPAHLLAELEAYFANLNLDANALDERYLLTVLIPGGEQRAAEQARAAGAAIVPAPSPSSAASASASASGLLPPLPAAAEAAVRATLQQQQLRRPQQSQPQPAQPPRKQPEPADDRSSQSDRFGGSESYKDQDLPMGGLQFD
ncbi:MAG: serine/threonine protein kinase, partial [Planctomycetota bacterium]